MISNARVTRSMAPTQKHTIDAWPSNSSVSGSMDISPMPAAKKYKSFHTYEAMDITPQKANTRVPEVARPFMVHKGLDKMWGVCSEEVEGLMRQRENLHREYKPAAKWLQFRRVLVDWMCEAGDEFNLKLSTMHVSVMLLDRILHNTSVTRNKLQLVAIACILIAAKYEETEEAVPSLSDMNRYAQWAYDQDQIYHMEIMVLNKLNWCLGTYTPLHFAGYYMSKGVLFHPDTMQGRPLVKKVPGYLKRYVEFFADLCLQDYSFQKYSPSLMAAAIVMASRKALSIGPIWRPELSALCKYEEEEVRPCFAAIWECYRSSFPAAQGTEDEYTISPTSIASGPQ